MFNNIIRDYDNSKHNSKKDKHGNFVNPFI